MMRISNPNPRAVHRLQQKIRITNSTTLAVEFPNLKSLTVHLLYFDRGGLMKTGEVKYKVNVDNAKSVFTFVCPNNECGEGDFDLSSALATAIKNRNKVVNGELRCGGSRTRFKGEKSPCGNLLRYKLTLSYA
jgi:hypothetical protein